MTAPPRPRTAGSLLDRTHARLRALPYPVRVVSVTVVGSVLVLAGLAMLVLPGPGLVVLFAGVAVLSTEFPWAARLLHRMTEAASRLWAAVRSWFRRRRAEHS